jgi:hypothetical protein
VVLAATGAVALLRVLSRVLRFFVDVQKTTLAASLQGYWPRSRSQYV